MLEAGESLEELEDLIVFGNDVVGLLPNITSARTGVIMLYKVEESRLELNGLNFKQLSLYVYLNHGKTGDLQELRKYFPWRKKVDGVAQE